MSAVAANRCPRCGNDNRIDSYVCAFCGKRLRIEKIENFSIFKRIEAEWTNPVPWYKLILWLLIKPNEAFWNINHKRKGSPGFKILLFNSVLYGLMGLALFSHVIIQDLDFNPFISFLFNFAVFIAFFSFGFAFFAIFGFVLIWLFTKGANIAVGFSERLESRFGGKEEEPIKYREAEMSPFSIYKGGTLHQQQAFKYKMMYCAFVPFLIITPVEIIIILVGLPNIATPDLLILNFSSLFNPIFISPIWTVLHLIEALTIAIWVPILTSLAIRELSNSSTIRVLLSSIVIGVIVAILFYFLRPTFMV